MVEPILVYLFIGAIIASMNVLCSVFSFGHWHGIKWEVVVIVWVILWPLAIFLWAMSAVIDFALKRNEV